MNFVQMRAFNALVKFGTITAAAEFLNVSKPAITTHLKNLEQTLGVRLFNRKGHSLEISQAGAAFIEPARTIGRILDEMNNIAARTSNKDEGHLRIGSCAPFTVIPILAMFTQKYPGIKTETKINNSDILADRIRQHELDVSIATLQDPPDDFFSLRLITQRILGIVSKVHPFANRRSISITELADIPCIMRESGSMTRSIIEIALKQRNTELKNVLEIGSREAVKEAVAQNLGLGFIFNHEIGYDNRLVKLEITGANLEAGEYLYCDKNLATLGNIKVFIDVALEVFNETAEKKVLSEVN